jgi:D-alanyl-lipoteichoic acid acyltransferase DltB (MBOAT superfamily)
LLIYRRLATRQQNVLLLVASYLFYGWWDWRFLSLIWFSTIVDYLVGLRLGRSETTRRRALLMISIVTNLGLLGFFKYFNFFVDSAALLIESIGLSANLPTLRVILPVGISFYTFQTLGYTIDVYRGKIAPEHDPVVFATYVAYFPQLVAGPIERATHLLPQIRQPRRADNDQLASGALLILIGLTRKVAIADPLASIVDGAFANPAIWGSGDLLLAVAAFALQIYCDFAGYTDIARGTSRMLGIELMENFNHPYFASDITTFWHRWHISLSTWLRDYVYIPLGGNRGTRLFTYRNIMITMLLGGMWHGAAWTFVVWGGIHGVALVAHKWFTKGRPPEHTATRAGRLLGWSTCTALVLFAWIFFRAETFGIAYQMIVGIGALRGGPPEAAALAKFIAIFALLLLIDVPQYRRGTHTAIIEWHWLPRGLVYAALIFLILLLAPEDDVPFIYFQF